MPVRLPVIHTRSSQARLSRTAIAIVLALMVILGFAVVFVLFGRQPGGDSPVDINGTTVPPVPTLNAERVEQGATLYAENCAKCHGPTLAGAADWKKSLPDGSLPPPPHDSTGHTWHHPDALLLQIVTKGGDPAYNSKMPSFQDNLSEEEIVAILEFIKSHWGQPEREFQWWMTATDSNQ